jgi:hypothetical protein
MRGSHHIGRALRNSALLWAGAVLLPALSPRGDAAGDGRVTFQDITSAAGIRFVNAAAPEKRYIVESMPGGVALFDFDRDGRLDVYLVNSYTVEAALGGRPRAALYRKRLDGAFADVAEKAGVADPGWAMGVAVADYDNDGFDDLYVTCFGPNRLYHNRDGRLDLFVANLIWRNLIENHPSFGGCAGPSWLLSSDASRVVLYRNSNGLSRQISGLPVLLALGVHPGLSGGLRGAQITRGRLTTPSCLFAACAWEWDCPNPTSGAQCAYAYS